MAVYNAATTTTTTDGTSTDIAPSGLAAGDVLEIKATTAGIWVNTLGGASSVKGANCIHIPQDGWVVITSKTTTLTAIRESTTDAVITVATLGGLP